MIQKGTFVSPADNSGVLWARVFHLHYGFSRRIAYTGGFAKVSVRETLPNNWLSKKTKCKAIILRTRKELKKFDGSYVRFNTNSVVLLKKRMNCYGTVILGPIPSTIRRRKFSRSFPGII